MIHWSIRRRIDESTFRTNDSVEYSIVTKTHAESSGRQYDFLLKKFTKTQKVNES